MATSRNRPEDDLGARLIDVAIGMVLGIPASIVLWAVTIWMLLG